MSSFFKALRNTLTPNVMDCPYCGIRITFNEDRGINIAATTYLEQECPSCRKEIRYMHLIPDIRRVNKISEVIAIDYLILSQFLIKFLKSRGEIYSNEWDYFINYLKRDEGLNNNQIDDLNDKYNILYNFEINSVTDAASYVKRNLKYLEHNWEKRIELVKMIGQINGKINEKQELLLKEYYNAFNIQSHRANTRKVDYKKMAGSVIEELNRLNDENKIKLINEEKCDGLIKLINLACDKAVNPIIINIAKYRGSLRRILNTKLERVDFNQDRYIDVLITNVIYYSNTIPNIKYAFKSYLENDKIISEEELNQLIYNIQQAFRVPEYKYNQQDVSNKNRYLNMYPISRRIESLEYDYSYYYTYAEILFELLAILTKSNNNYLLLEKSATQVLNLIDKCIKANIANILAGR